MLVTVIYGHKNAADTSTTKSSPSKGHNHRLGAGRFTLIWPEVHTTAAAQGVYNWMRVSWSPGSHGRG